MAINRDDREMADVAVALDGFAPAPEAERLVLTGPSATSHNDVADRQPAYHPMEFARVFRECKGHVVSGCDATPSAFWLAGTLEPLVEKGARIKAPGMAARGDVPRHDPAGRGRGDDGADDPGGREQDGSEAHRR